MKVSFLDLERQHKKILPQYFKQLKQLFSDSDFILGKQVGLFEQEFADYCRCSYAIGVNSGTDALFLGLLSLGIGKGDEVLVPAFTYIASALAVTYAQARPVFVDIDPLTYNLDLSQVKRHLNKKVKAVMPVHLFGQPADMPALLNLRDKYGFKIIEDCAQAHGAEIQMADGRWQMAGKDKNTKAIKVGAFGDIGCFSFYPTKNLGAAGDGGMIVSNKKEIFERLRRLRDYGRIGRYRHESIGYNSRLDTIQAALLRLKLKRLDTYNYKRRQAAAYYSKLLSGLPQVTLPFIKKGCQSVFNVYAVAFSQRAKALAEFKKNNISALIHYPIPLHLQKVYKDLGYRKGDFPVAEKLAGRIVSLPIFADIQKKEIGYVAKIIKQAIK